MNMLKSEQLGVLKEYCLFMLLMSVERTSLELFLVTAVPHRKLISVNIVNNVGVSRVRRNKILSSILSWFVVEQAVRIPEKSLVRIQSIYTVLYLQRNIQYNSQKPRWEYQSQ